MKRLVALGLSVFTLIAVAAGPVRAELPTLRVGVLKFGTVNWLMETIVANRLDEAAGVKLDVVKLAGRPATTVAFAAGDVDTIVIDWVWALDQRGKGRDLRFAPYSNALGALIGGETVASLCDLDGRTVGIVGGPRDKSWLVYQALATAECGIDLATATSGVYGAPPLMSQQLIGGDVDAVSTYWHFAAKLEAAGFDKVISVNEALSRLGIEPAPSMIGFVWDEGKSDPAAVAAFVAAVQSAGQMLIDDDAAWDRLRPLMRAKTDAEFEALRAGFRAGVPGAWTDADTEAARRLHALMIAQGGAEFAASAGTFDDRLFMAPGAH